MTADTTPDTSQRGELLWLNPADLLAHTRNVRDDLGDLTELTASIAATGVLEPLIVVPTGDGEHYAILAGHRRAAAAVAAKAIAVACLVRPDLAAAEDDKAGQARHVATMLTENVIREGLSATEEARAVQTMLDLGQNVTRIVKATGLNRKRVVKGAAVARLDTGSLRMIDEAELPLNMAAAVSEFAGDPEAIAALVTAGAQGEGAFAHALERAKRDKAAAKALADKKAELAAAGVRLIEVPASNSGKENRFLSGLLAAPALPGTPAEPLDVTNHADCPGHAARLRPPTFSSDEPTVEFVCTEPFAYGHAERWAASTGSTPKVAAAELPDAEREAAAEARRELIANNKAMDAANTVRRQWLAEFLQRRTAPKGLLRFAVEALAAGNLMSGWFGYGSAIQDLADTPLGAVIRRPYGTSWGVAPEKSLTSGEVVGDGRLPLQLFGHVVGAFEQSIARDSWRDGHSHHAKWLTFLESLGYGLADVEHNLIGIATAKAEEAEEKAAAAAELAARLSAENRAAHGLGQVEEERAVELAAAVAGDLADGSIEPYADEDFDPEAAGAEPAPILADGGF